MLCEKTRIEMVEENSRKYFQNTLDKLSFLIRNICSQISGENFLMELEKLAQNPLKNLIENSPPKSHFIGLEKLAVGSQNGLTVDRPVDRQRSDF